MKMENNSFKDAVKLAEAIYDEIYPHQSSALWTVINIAKNKNRTFKVPEDSEIPLSYGYTHDEAIEILRDCGVFEIGEKGRWFINFVDEWSRYDTPIAGVITEDDKISQECRSQGYIAAERALYHKDFENKDGKSKTEGLYAVLVNVKSLNKFLRSAEKLMSQRDYWYENGQLKFMLVGGEVDQLDFSKAELSKKLFETFFKLWKSDGYGEYSVNRITSKYKELFNDDLDAPRIGEMVSNIRASIINPKPLLNNRLEWRFDRKTKVWIFKIIPRNPQSY